MRWVGEGPGNPLKRWVRRPERLCKRRSKAGMEQGGWCRAAAAVELGVEGDQEEKTREKKQKKRDRREADRERLDKRLDKWSWSGDGKKSRPELGRELRDTGINAPI